MDWIKVPGVLGEKLEMDFYVRQRDGKIVIGVRGRF